MRNLDFNSSGSVREIRVLEEFEKDGDLMPSCLLCLKSIAINLA